MCPDFFYKQGKPHAIRSSPGYEVAFENLKPQDKNYLRKAGDSKAYTNTNPRKERAERVEHAASRASNKMRVSGSGKLLTREAQENRFKPKSKSRIY